MARRSTGGSSIGAGRRRGGPRVALIFPETRYPSGQPPLGIGYLASWLERETDADVRVHDLSFSRDPFGALERSLREEPCRLVGVSVVTPHLREARKVAALAKAVNPGCLVVFGGPHPTILPEATLADPNVDVVCLGEGEETLADLLRAGGPAESIPGIAFRAERRRAPGRSGGRDPVTSDTPAAAGGSAAQAAAGTEGNRAGSGGCVAFEFPDADGAGGPGSGSGGHAASESSVAVGAQGDGADGGRDIVVTPRRPFSGDLDAIPPPARHLFDMENYFRSWYSMDSWRPGLRGTSVIASRGCPYGCTFCQPTIAAVFGRALRKRRPEPVVDELEELRGRYGIQAFMFEDSLFLLDRKWVARICDLMLERRLGLVWCCNVRADLLDRETLRHMREAGLRKVNIGVESAVPRVLNGIYEKGETVEAVESGVRLCHELGLRVQGYFMMGALGETAEEIERTVRFAVGLPFDDAVFDITTPFPGTVLYERTRERVRLPFEEFDCFHVSAYDGGEGLSGAAIERLKKRAYYRFYLRPRRALRLAGQLLTPTGVRRTLLKMRRV